MNTINFQIQYPVSFPLQTSAKTTTGCFPIEIFAIIFSFVPNNNIACLNQFWNEKIITIIKNDALSQIQHSFHFLSGHFALPPLSFVSLAKAGSLSQIKAAVDQLKDKLRTPLQTIRRPCLERLKKLAENRNPFAYDLIDNESIICRIENAEWYYWVRHKIPYLLIQNIAEQVIQTCDLAKVNKIMGSIKPKSFIRKELNRFIFSRLCLKFLEKGDWKKLEKAAVLSEDDRVQTPMLAFLAEKALQGSELQQAGYFARKVPDPDVKASLLKRISRRAANPHYANGLIALLLPQDLIKVICLNYLENGAKMACLNKTWNKMIIQHVKDQKLLELAELVKFLSKRLPYLVCLADLRSLEGAESSLRRAITKGKGCNQIKAMFKQTMIQALVKNEYQDLADLAKVQEGSLFLNHLFVLSKIYKCMQLGMVRKFEYCINWMLDTHHFAEAFDYPDLLGREPREIYFRHLARALINRGSFKNALRATKEIEKLTHPHPSLIEDLMCDLYEEALEKGDLKTALEAAKKSDQYDEYKIVKRIIPILTMHLKKKEIALALDVMKILSSEYHPYEGTRVISLYLKEEYMASHELFRFLKLISPKYNPCRESLILDAAEAYLTQERYDDAFEVLKKAPYSDKKINLVMSLSDRYKAAGNGEKANEAAELRTCLIC